MVIWVWKKFSRCERLPYFIPYIDITKRTGWVCCSCIGPRYVLMQHSKDIAFIFRQYKVHDSYDPSHNFELVAVGFAMKIWHHYIYGVHVDIFTDHKILHYLFSRRDLNLWQRRWIEPLKDYDMSVLYHLGKYNVVVDTLNQMSMSRVAHVKYGRK